MTKAMVVASMMKDGPILKEMGRASSLMKAEKKQKWASKKAVRQSFLPLDHEYPQKPMVQDPPEFAPLLHFCLCKYAMLAKAIVAPVCCVPKASLLGQFFGALELHAKIVPDIHSCITLYIIAYIQLWIYFYLCYLLNKSISVNERKRRRFGRSTLIWMRKTVFWWKRGSTQ